MKLLRHPVAFDIAGRVAARYVRVAWACCRWRIDNAQILDDLAAAGRPAILCCWHGRMLIIPRVIFRRPAARVNALASPHRDGMLIARLLGHLGIGFVAGSSRRGGAQGLLGAVRHLRGGGSLILTPDGPRGPRMRAAPGAVTAAKLSGSPLLPVAGAFSPCRTLGTWDRFTLPLPVPFSRGILRIGTPIEVPGDADRAEIARLRRTLEDEMIRLTHDVDAALGLPVTEPAAEPPRPAA